MKRLIRGIDYYGEVGLPTKFKDKDGNRLYIGDVVNVKKHRTDHGNSFVVESKDKQFIMGIYSDCNHDTERVNSLWTITLVKSFAEVGLSEKHDDISICSNELTSKYNLMMKRKRYAL